MTVMLDNLAASRSPVRVAWHPDGTWAFDVPAITNAARELGIEQPITLTAIRGRGGRRRNGYHSADANGHDVRVVMGLSAARASTVLWHELAHAAQAESYPTIHAFDQAYERAGGASGPSYRSNRFELEAQALADEHADDALTR